MTTEQLLVLIDQKLANLGVMLGTNSNTTTTLLLCGFMFLCAFSGLRFGFEFGVRD
jgi:hypothetical protein